MGNSRCEHELYKSAYVDKNQWLYQCSKCTHYLISGDGIAIPVNNKDCYSTTKEITKTDIELRLRLAGQVIFC